ncbi:hypothetical protein ACFVMC_29135 [Nocardia sp. NPDC127579]|uniref:LppU family putative lipoprotein n=1 Tax=Nocardia sp. NPDC127579 TaxID=3345402 RepID=UPI0036308760
MKSATQFRVAVGECVSIPGPNPIEKSSCGGPTSQYRVTDKVSASAQCPGDSDRTYHETSLSSDPDALCLDIDWTTGGCMDIAGGPRHIDCATIAAAADGVRVLAIKSGTVDANTCAAVGSKRGFVYPQRRFVVCLAEL